jgi:hypothetical protein
VLLQQRLLPVAAHPHKLTARMFKLKSSVAAT